MDLDEPDFESTIVSELMDTSFYSENGKSVSFSNRHLLEDEIQLLTDAKQITPKMEKDFTKIVKLKLLASKDGATIQAKQRGQVI